MLTYEQNVKTILESVFAGYKDELIENACKMICTLNDSEKPKTDVLDKIRVEIERQEKWLFQAGYNAYNVDIAFSSIKSVLAESEGNE